jgi:EAL domain-containing protein (putative c-di-GMP-specific phosphodiesterase class I)
MFVLVRRQEGADASLRQAFESMFHPASIVEEFGFLQFNDLMTQKVTALAFDCRTIRDEDTVLIQALLGVSNLVPTVYFNVTEPVRRAAAANRPPCAAFCADDNATEILDAMQALLARSSDSIASPSIKGIPVFERHYASQFMKDGAGLSLLAIDASLFAAIEARFGRLAFEESVQHFNNMLSELWGTSGSFRARDMLCLHRELNLVYLVLLESNRSLGRLPPPGSLEKVADRVQIQIDNRLWQSLGRSQGSGGLPRGMSMIPQVKVGYASAATSLLEPEDRLIERVVSEAVRSTSLQEKRLNIRRKEYVQNLIAAADSLHPSFQAVFQLQKLTKDVCEEANRTKSLGPLSPLLFGFESLIRAQKDVIQDLLGSSQLITMDPTLLRPDVLFTLAKSVDADLELDLRAMKQALTYSEGLPGKLMINILPRNFYNLKKIRKNLPHDSRIIFEVSESEAIENFDLVQEVRADLRSMNIGVATDDFGRDYGGLERIFKIRPDIIKLDRALISNIHEDPPRLAFVSGLVQSVQVIQATTLAEGVETWEEAQALQDIGIDLVQGFLLHRPQRAEEIMESLSRGAPSSFMDDNSDEHWQGAQVIPLKAS